LKTPLPVKVGDNTDRDCQRDDKDVLIVKSTVYFPLKEAFIYMICVVYFLEQKIIPVKISHLYFAFGRWRRIFSKALNNPST
jgi:hypothetical protein